MFSVRIYDAHSVKIFSDSFVAQEKVTSDFAVFGAEVLAPKVAGEYSIGLEYPHWTTGKPIYQKMNEARFTAH